MPSGIWCLTLVRSESHKAAVTPSGSQCNAFKFKFLAALVMYFGDC
ncbi:hypothetical protein PS681_01105 [Pseudomonas fluorescens]|nr:hypothetical protein PS681_01105 [Pseudomonas fluorescens]